MSQPSVGRPDEAWFEDGMEVAEVGLFVGVEGEDGEQRSHSLLVIPWERHPERCAEKAGKHSYSWIVSWSP
jgi:hypothetical protein